ncbi:MAG: ferredoxin [Mycobacterium sp.]
MHVTVDYELCEGHGQCLLADPDIFDIPDDAEQVVVLEPNPPEADRERVLRAAAMCPAQAIHILN